ncbi:helix-turn-helix transcriptional regulator [Campylobacter magnus]|uniref:WYL domain-containing protein n=1 Tax=Campylobacter magnus TaxID=3026462 RepID=A0ABT8T7G6_9BACT|nr:WYL domain-containing protein [Campylobacter magnus]MDO2409210.1 WYL domain-containing protein [Campylobacter magnus]
MSKTSSIYRILEMIKDLQNGKTLNVDTLAMNYEITDRTIRRDFALIEEIFGDILIHPSNKSYAMVQRNEFQNLINGSELAILKEFLKLGQKTRLNIGDELKQNVKDALLRKSDSVYIFKHKPFEEIFNEKEKFQKLEFAVKHRKEIKYTYQKDDKIKQIVTMPHKIIFIKENFYLAGLKDKQKMLLSRIALIKDIEFTGKEFRKNFDFEEFLDYISSPWAEYHPNFKEKLVEIEIEIEKSQSKYFRLKKFHPSQKIINTNDNGNIRVKFLVTHSEEIIEILKGWIPYVKIIKPKELKKKFFDIAKKFYFDMLD